MQKEIVLVVMKYYLLMHVMEIRKHLISSVLLTVIIHKYIVLFGCILILLSHCTIDEHSLRTLDISKSLDFKVPVEYGVELSGMRLSVMDSLILYKGRISEDIYIYDFKNNILSKDTFLRKEDYIFTNTRPAGVLDEYLVLYDSKNLYLYDLFTKKIVKEKLSGQFKNSIANDHNLLFGSGFGFSNRTYKKFIPLVPWRNYIDNNEFTLYFYYPNKVQKHLLQLPIELLDHIRNCNSNLLSPMIEPDIDGNGVTLIFSLSCRIFHINEQGEISEFGSMDPDFICEINEENFVKASGSNFYPKQLPTYSNMFADKYRHLYFQFAETKFFNEIGTRKIYLRVLSENFNPIAKVEINWNQYAANLLILKEGVFIQSAAPPDESNLYFHKVELN